MKEKIAYPFLVISLINNACDSAKKNTVEKDAKWEINWQDSPIIVDGSDTDWDKSKMEFDRKSNIAYKFTNDANNIYVLLILYDNRTQMKILNAGISLYIDPTGKNKENTVIDYSLKVDNRFSYSQQLLNKGSENEKKYVLTNAGEYVLQGFKIGDGHYSIIENNKAGIRIKIGIDSMNEMVYEATIPFSNIYNGKNAVNAGRRFSLGFKINGLSKSNVSEIMFQKPDSNSNKTSNNKISDAQILSNTVKIWKNITMASKQSKD